MLTFYTPTHRPQELIKPYRALRAFPYQADTRLRWLILLNGEASIDDVPCDVKNDPRVILKCAPTGTSSNIGALKKLACDMALAETECVSLVELDHDDELTLDAIEALSSYAHAEKFHFSNTGCYGAFNRAYGWDAHTEKLQTSNTEDAKPYWVHEAFECNARSLCEIFYAPNHVRMWGREAYIRSGKYLESLEVCDDQDLLIRTYLTGTEMVHINKALYVQHEGPEQTQVKKNGLIQEKQAQLRDEYTEKLVLEEARRRELLAIDLGAIEPRHGYKTLNMLPGCDIQHNVLKPLPFLDNSVQVFRASDFLEHIPSENVVPVMNELYRCLAPGGWMLTMTPSTDGRGAFQDPTHRSYWNSNSFWYYTKREHQLYLPESRSRYQMVSLKNFHPNDFAKLHNIVYTQANMWALKGQKNIGAVSI